MDYRTATREERAAEFIDFATKLHDGRYDYAHVPLGYVNGDTKVTIICPDHGPFEQTPREHRRVRETPWGPQRGQGCRSCKGFRNANRSCARSVSSNEQPTARRQVRLREGRLHRPKDLRHGDLPAAWGTSRTPRQPCGGGLGRLQRLPSPGPKDNPIEDEAEVAGSRPEPLPLRASTGELAELKTITVAFHGMFSRFVNMPQ